MRTVAATESRTFSDRWAMYAALAAAEFRRYTTYRQAVVAAIFTNSVFGFVRCFVLLAVAGGAAGGTAAGYSRERLVTYVWIGQGLLGTVNIWGGPELADRIRTGDVVADLLRPVDPVWQYLAADLGRGAFAALSRLLVPVAVGAFAFDLYAPTRAVTYPLFALSLLLATVVSFACRHLVNASAYWLLDARGPQMGWVAASSALSGMAFPLAFLPAPLMAGLYLLTPLPYLIQVPSDVLVERYSPSTTATMVAGQAVWAVVMLGVARLVQRRAERRVVIQGG